MLALWRFLIGNAILVASFLVRVHCEER